MSKQQKTESQKSSWPKMLALGLAAVVVMVGGFLTGRALNGLMQDATNEVGFEASVSGADEDEGVEKDEAKVGEPETPGDAPEKEEGDTAGEGGSAGGSADNAGGSAGATGGAAGGAGGSSSGNTGAGDGNVGGGTTPVESTGRKYVALTFDDGPSTATTGRLLDILKAKNVKATFFVVGRMARNAPDLVRREEAEGHEVGSHSTAHQDLSKLSAASLQADVVEMDRVFMEILGRQVAIMRPPYGAVSSVMRSSIGKPMINWAVDPLDWKYKNAATVRQNVVSATFDGAIVLMHDIHATTVDAVANIIDDLRARGYEFLTVSELAALRGVNMANGVVYYYFK